MARGVLLSETDQKSLLAVLDDTPPLELFWRCQTEDQQKMFREVRSGLHWQKRILEAYFSGNKPPIGELTKLNRDFYLALTDMHLRFYDLLFYGWDDIEKAIKKKHGSLDGFPRTPGQALIKVIELEAEGCLEPAFAKYDRWTPYQERKVQKLAKEAKRASPTEKALNSYNSEIRKARQMFGRFLNLKHSCLQTLTDKKRPSKQLKRALGSYLVAKAEVDRTVESSVHKSRQEKGYEWRNGYRKDA